MTISVKISYLSQSIFCERGQTNKNLSHILKFHLILGDFGIQHSKTGYMTSKIMLQYMKFFRKTLDHKGTFDTVFYFFDRHGSHMDIELAKYCRDNRIVTIALYGNSTRIIQPLDVGLFGAIKKSYKYEVDRWIQDHSGEQFTIADVTPTVKVVNDKVATCEVIKKSFRRCGLWPWDADNIDYSRCLARNTFHQLSTQQDNNSDNTSSCSISDSNISEPSNVIILSNVLLQPAFFNVDPTLLQLTSEVTELKEQAAAMAKILTF